jgi:hypothetical protein
MNPSTVRIRMYKQGLGDCFLITFPRSDGSNYQILIDCGAVIGSAAKDVVDAAQDIFTTTGGHLDLLVGTHEHWDHLSGFNQARDLFDKFSIDNIWLAWTEDPNNPDASSMVKDRGAKVAALNSALTHLNVTDSAQANSIRNVLDFFGEAPYASAAEGFGAAATRALGSTSEAMRYLRTRTGAQVHYCYPLKDPPHTLDGVDDVRVYAFGPPTDLKLLKQDMPTQRGHETYGLTARQASESFLAALSRPALAADEGAAPAPEGTRDPFDDYYRVSLEEAQNPLADEFYRMHYGFKKYDAEKWRRIDTDWLGMTSELALNLDSDTNNTSLVLAFELGDPGSGKVLLFAADAQVGNWLSWGGLNWTVRTPGKVPVLVNSHDLLNRTVVYKVGHHGSHNATLSDQGLELMTSNDLVALLPVVQSMAAKKGWGAMPFDLLMTALKKKTHGRIMRIDNGLPNRSDAADLSESDWQTFTQRAVETKLYIEYTLPY